MSKDNSFLELNLSKYPKLERLLDTDVAERSRFLKDIKNLMFTGGLTYTQALTACAVIDEKSKRVRRER
jgi:hypothetical protein